MIPGFDADQDCTDIAVLSYDRGARWVGRYISKATGGLTLLEVRAFASVGMRIVPIWETTAQRALNGARAGIDDGMAARWAITLLGMDHGAVCFTADFDVSEPQQEAVLDYFRGCQVGLGASVGQPIIKTMVYANGAVCGAAQAEDIADYTWLAGGMGMRGSLDYAKSGKATIIQGVGDGFSARWQPPGGWAPLSLQIDLDADVALSDGFGGWLPAAAQSTQPPKPTSPLPDYPNDPLRRLQAVLGISVDGDWGPQSEAAWQEWRAAH